MTPYADNLSTVAGTYRIVVGSRFLLGSTTALGSTIRAERSLLDRGKHPQLQAEFDRGGQFVAFLLKEIPRKDDDSDSDHCKRLEFHEQILLDRFFDTPACSNTSRCSSRGGLAERWKEPAFRQKMLDVLAVRAAAGIRPSTRSKMSAAKRGSLNSRSRPCFTTLEGVTREFACVSDAATFHGVKQQILDLWIRGLVRWPGQGRLPRASSRHLLGMTGGYR